MPITGSVEPNGEMFAAHLRAARNADGGFGPRPKIPSEPEPTALATLALDDDAGRSWLASRQAADGSVPFDAAVVVNDSSTALAAIAFGSGSEHERALDHLEASLARTTPSTPSVPHDESVHGWGWTEGTFGWVEPTSRGVLALRLFRPGASSIADGLGLLGDRETVGGGWNYGNRVVFGDDLWPYAQTTAVALLALQGTDPELEERGMGVLRTLWRDEREGGLSLAMSNAVLGLRRDSDATEARRALFELFERTSFMGDVVTLAWAAIATGPALSRLGVAS